LHVNPISALFYSAVINGVVAVPLVATIVVLAGDRTRMGRWASTPVARAWGWLTVVVMTLAAVGMFCFAGTG
jgi:Mn2+/Fe2+ NRAMP family transporter